MKKQLEVWKFINKCLEKDIPVMLLYVVESTGSSPGRQGFFMAVNTVGEMEGSIGGGIMEHKFVEMSKQKLKEDDDQLLLRKQFHNKSAPTHQSGMICSGEQTIVVYKLQESDKIHVENIISILQLNKTGSLKLSPTGISYSDITPSQHYKFEMQGEEDWRYIEKIGYKNHLYIIGAGHCALALSKIMSMMDFYIHLFDERVGLNTMFRNEFAHEKKLINDFRMLGDIIPSGANTYIVIMTVGYRTDDLALRSLIGKEFKYVGLLGSSKKIEKMFNDYWNERLDEEWLSKVHSPIGLQIRSQTPEEIAISIAAEIINVKNEPGSI